MEVLIPLPVKDVLRRGLHDPVEFNRWFLDLESGKHIGRDQWLRESYRPENILAAGKRWTKSTTQASKLIRYCVYQIEKKPKPKPRLIPYRTVNVSLTLDQAKIIHDVAIILLQNTVKAKWLIDWDRCVETPFPNIRFRNGSQLWARSTKYKAKYLEGHQFGFINYDEAQYEVDETIVDNVLTNRVTDVDGIIDLVGSPLGMNWFYRKFEGLLQDGQRKERGVDFYSQRGSSFENPWISHDRLKRDEKMLPRWLVQQNIYAEFVSPATAVFNIEHLKACLMADPEFPAIQDEGIELRRKEKPVDGHYYVNGWDVAFAQDWTWGITLDITARPARLVALERFRKQPWPFVEARIKRRHEYYGGKTIIDETGIGASTLHHLHSSGVPAEGFVFTGPSKQDLISNAQRMIETHALEMPFFAPLMDQLQSYERDDEHLETDGVMSLALALWKAGKLQRVGRIGLEWIA